MRIIYILLLCVFFIFSSSVFSKDEITKEHLESFGSVEYNKFGIAFIIYQSKWVAINRKQKVLYEVYNFDNGPDYFQEGLHRFVENGKIGFANERGKKVIPAQFDFAYPFEKGKASFCNQCSPESMGEHSFYDPKKGNWGLVNKKGKRLK